MHLPVLMFMGASATQSPPRFPPILPQRWRREYPPLRDRPTQRRAGIPEHLHAADLPRSPPAALRDPLPRDGVLELRGRDPPLGGAEPAGTSPPQQWFAVDNRWKVVHALGCEPPPPADCPKACHLWDRGPRGKPPGPFYVYGIETDAIRPVLPLRGRLPRRGRSPHPLAGGRSPWRPEAHGWGQTPSPEAEAHARSCGTLPRGETLDGQSDQGRHRWGPKGPKSHGEVQDQGETHLPGPLHRGQTLGWPAGISPWTPRPGPPRCRSGNQSRRNQRPRRFPEGHAIRGSPRRPGRVGPRDPRRDRERSGVRMPPFTAYKSDAQRRFFHTDTAKAKGISAEDVAGKDKVSKGRSLPKKVSRSPSRSR